MLSLKHSLSAPDLQSTSMVGVSEGPLGSDKWMPDRLDLSGISRGYGTAVADTTLAPCGRSTRAYAIAMPSGVVNTWVVVSPFDSAASSRSAQTRSASNKRTEKSNSTSKPAREWAANPEGFHKVHVNATTRAEWPEASKRPARQAGRSWAER